MKKPKTTIAKFMPPTPERGQHDELTVVSPDPNNPGIRRVQVLLPNRLRKYLALKSIGAKLCEAGEELAQDWYLAGMEQRTIVNLDGGRSTGGRTASNITPAQMDARSRLLKALGGSRAKYMKALIACCCFDESVNTNTLRLGLTELAMYYGMLSYPQRIR